MKKLWQMRGWVILRDDKPARYGDQAHEWTIHRTRAQARKFALTSDTIVRAECVLTIAQGKERP